MRNFASLHQINITYRTEIQISPNHLLIIINTETIKWYSSHHIRQYVYTRNTFCIVRVTLAYTVTQTTDGVIILTSRPVRGFCTAMFEIIS